MGDQHSGRRERWVPSNREDETHDAPLVDLLGSGVLVLVHEVLRPVNTCSSHDPSKDQLTLLRFSSMSFWHSSGTHVCTNLADELPSSPPDSIATTHDARFMFGFPSIASISTAPALPTVTAQNHPPRRSSSCRSW